MCTDPKYIFISNKLSDNDKALTTFTRYYELGIDDEVYANDKVFWLGKARHYFDEHYKEFEDYYVIPCGKCIECCLRRASEWSLRLMHESNFHESSCFLTLTYNDDNLPWAKYDHCPTLYKRHLQLFMKRLRKRFPGIKFRYYGCGEYGDTTHRPHYHMVLFGYDFSKDRELFSITKANHKLYISQTLSDLWSLGHCLIGDLNDKTAGYVAGYVTKKLKDKFEPAEDYTVLAESLDTTVSNLYKKGLIRVPEFSVMSNRPGIGFSILYDHGKQYLEHGYILNSNKKKCLIPRYYLKKLKDLYPDLWCFQEERLSDLTDPDAHDLYRRHKYREAIHKKFSRSSV